MSQSLQQQEECPSERREWPELKGKTYEEAEAAIKAQRPDLNVSRLLENSPATADYREDRVRIIVNNKGIVVTTPNVG